MLFILHQLDGLIRRIVPLLLCLICLILGIALTTIPGVAGIPPLLGLIAIYYWSVHRPDLLPLPLLFLLGLLADAMLRLPVGLSSLTYIGLAQLVHSQRHIFIDQSYLTLWFGFLVVLTAAQLLQWGLLSMFYREILPLLPLLLQSILTLMLFPLLVWPFSLLQRYLLR